MESTDSHSLNNKFKLTHLRNEILIHIIKYCIFDDNNSNNDSDDSSNIKEPYVILSKLSKTCRRFYNIANDFLLCKLIFVQKFDSPALERRIKGKQHLRNGGDNKENHVRTVNDYTCWK